MNALLRAALCAAALSAAGCGDDGPVAPTPPQHPYDGVWIGKFSDGQEIYLKIVMSRVAVFETIIWVTRTCGFGMEATPEVLIDGQGFTFNINNSFLSAATVTARFESERRLTGTFGAMTTVRRQCSTDPPVAFAARTFTADQ